jgi:serine/threonine-protein kinase HipA
MAKPSEVRRRIEVFADWAELGQPTLLGTLTATRLRAKETFAFEYDRDWVKSGRAQNLDPDLLFFEGAQHPRQRSNFGMFLDSCPDRWGRFLLDRREAQLARDQDRPSVPLTESDYLLGVFDEHRLGGLRFRLSGEGPFLDDQREHSSPPWASLRELEQASWQLEHAETTDPNYRRWLRMLIAPGGSLGGARPKASVIDPEGHLWIAKFPSRGDRVNTGAWECLLYRLAEKTQIEVSAYQVRQFNTPHHTFLTRRFDRHGSVRCHFSSALNLLGRNDGDDHHCGASYLELVELMQRAGRQPEADLEQLWRRIVFNICVSNSDDHLRNHGFLWTPLGWKLSPAYDLNPDPYSDGLKLNISENDNAQDLDLAMEVAVYFRVKSQRAKAIRDELLCGLANWREEASKLGISREEIEQMSSAFRL